MQNKIPTTIFSGFLGSGKTTIISNLIETLQKRGEQVVYIKNEIGDTDIDTKILQGKGIKTKELLNGCICCTLVGPFISSITEAVETFKPERIIIEASGAADPSALALMVSSHPLLIRDSVIAIIDVVNFNGYKNLTITTQNQTKFTDLIVFNKIELVDLQQKKAVVGYVRELNSHSPIVEAPQGIINPAVIFGLTTKELDKLLTQNKQTHSDHIHQDEIQAFTLPLLHTTTIQQLEEFLQQLPKNIFRAKGFATIKPENTLENNRKNKKDISILKSKKLTDSNTILIFNTVGKRTTFLQAPVTFKNENQLGLLVFIGYHANENEAEITKTAKQLL